MTRSEWGPCVRCGKPASAVYYTARLERRREYRSVVTQARVLTRKVGA